MGALNKGGQRDYGMVLFPAERAMMPGGTLGCHNPG